MVFNRSAGLFLASLLFCLKALAWDVGKPSVQYTLEDKRFDGFTEHYMVQKQLVKQTGQKNSCNDSKLTLTFRYRSSGKDFKTIELGDFSKKGELLHSNPITYDAENDRLWIASMAYADSKDCNQMSPLIYSIDLGGEIDKKPVVKTYTTTKEFYSGSVSYPSSIAIIKGGDGTAYFAVDTNTIAPGEVWFCRIASGSSSVACNQLENLTEMASLAAKTPKLKQQRSKSTAVQKYQKPRVSASGPIRGGWMHQQLQHDPYTGQFVVAYTISDQMPFLLAIDRTGSVVNHLFSLTSFEALYEFKIENRYAFALSYTMTSGRYIVLDLETGETQKLDNFVGSDNVDYPVAFTTTTDSDGDAWLYMAKYQFPGGETYLSDERSLLKGSVHGIQHYERYIWGLDDGPEYMIRPSQGKQTRLTSLGMFAGTRGSWVFSPAMQFDGNHLNKPVAFSLQAYDGDGSLKSEINLPYFTNRTMCAVVQHPNSEIRVFNTTNGTEAFLNYYVPKNCTSDTCDCPVTTYTVKIDYH